jgi:predicted alpha/beta-hydrolase family hydrolase
VISFEVGTTQGPAMLDWTAPTGGAALAPAPGAVQLRFIMALTHGAGGTINSPDLLAARDAALRLGGGVALITQPYRVRGARAPGNADRQDEAWTDLMAWLRSPDSPASPATPQPDIPPAPHSSHRPRKSQQPHEPRVPLIAGGRSNGARVACRTAAAVGARGVLALAFPLQPPARRSRGSDELTFPPDRSPELRAATAGGGHVLVLNGDRDPFGIPAGDASTQVVVLDGETHSLSKKPAAVTGAVAAWLSTVALPAL